MKSLNLSKTPLLSKFLPYYKPHLKLFAFDIACAAAVAVIDLIYPFYSRAFVNDYIPNGRWEAMIITAMAFLGLYGLRMVCNYFMSFKGHVMGTRIEKDMRSDLFRHIQTLPFLYFDETRTGQVMSRLMGDLQEVGELSHHGPEDLFISMMLMVGSMGILAFLNPLLTLVLLGIVIVLVIFVWTARTKTTAAFHAIRVRHAEINARIESCISGIRLSKSFTNEQYDNDRFEENNSALLNAWRNGHRLLGVVNAGSTFLIDILGVVAIGLGSLFTFWGYMTLGDLVAFLLYMAIFLTPVRRLTQFAQQYMEGIAGFARFVELMSLPSSMMDTPGAKELPRASGDIEFRDVGFRYNENLPWILRDFTLKLRPGEIVALVGASGVGKTTLVHLIPRFYDVSAGAIFIDGTDIRNVTLQSLRRSVGIVQQDVFLFYGTIGENIRYGRPGASEEEMIDAAKKAGIYDFIMNLPQRFDSVVGERGIKLSGGQKQRVAIARIFLKNPPILILDEATSSLDSLTEMTVHEALLKLAEGRTTILVAHRLSTVRQAKEILVLSDNRVVERGTHQALLEHRGIYHELYHAQYSEFRE